MAVMIKHDDKVQEFITTEIKCTNLRLLKLHQYLYWNDSAHLKRDSAATNLDPKNYLLTKEPLLFNAKD